MTHYFEAQVGYKRRENALFTKRLMIVHLQSFIIYLYNNREAANHKIPNRTISLGKHKYIVSTNCLILTIKKQKHIFQLESIDALQYFMNILKSTIISTKNLKSQKSTKSEFVSFKLNRSKLDGYIDGTLVIQMSDFKTTENINSNAKQECKIDLVNEYLEKACNIYWNELKVNNINKTIEETKDEQYPLMDEFDPMTKLLLGINNTTNKDSIYLNDDDFQMMEWPFYFEYVVEKERNWKVIYKNCHRIFSLKSYKNKYHKNDTLSQNEILDFLWIYVGYCHWNAKNIEFTLGNIGIMMDFLSKLNHLFKAIIIAYDFEITHYGKLLNHYMKTYLKNINNELLYRAQQINRKQIIPNKTSTIYQSLKKEYDLLKLRMNACKFQLQENGIILQKM